MHTILLIYINSTIVLTLIFYIPSSCGMERKLIEAAEKGDVDKLHNLIKEYPLILKAVALGCGHNPLHMACIGGHLPFVKEVLKLGHPNFVEEKNADGFTPLHIASGGGDTEIVKELLKRGNHLCLIKGIAKRIPLHCAVSKGKTEVMRELLLACQDSITEVTVRGETCFHLALKNNQFEAFKVLCEYGDIEVVLNSKDQQGNTIWHLLASSRIQYEVADLLLDQRFPLKDKLELNSLNNNGVTPLDVFISQGGDCEIEEMLTLSGATRSPGAESVQHLAIATEDPPNNTSEQGRRRDRPRSATQKLQDYFKYDKVKESPSSARNTLLVIAVLIVTATYQAVLSPPGGVWQEDCSWPDAAAQNSTAKQPQNYTAGKSVMGTKNMGSYLSLLFFNSMGFFISIYMIYFLTYGFPLQFELRVALFALTTTYDVCMAAISPTGLLSLSFVALSVALPVVMYAVTTLIRNCKGTVTGII